MRPGSGNIILSGLVMATTRPAAASSTGVAVLVLLGHRRPPSPTAPSCSRAPTRCTSPLGRRRRRQLAWRMSLSPVQLAPLRGVRLDRAGLAVPAEHHVRRPRQLTGLHDRAVGQLHERAGGDVQPGLDHAVVAEADAEARVGAEQAALPDRDPLGPAARQGAHDRGPATDVAVVADHDALRDPSLHHRHAERAAVEVAEALVHHGGSLGEVGAEAHPRAVGDAHARSARRSRASAGTCRRRLTASAAPAARRANDTSGRSATATGPSSVHATLLSSPKMPSRLSVLGAANRCDSRCRRRYTSAADEGGASTSIVERIGRTTTRRTSSVRSPPASAASVSSGADSP